MGFGAMPAGYRMKRQANVVSDDLSSLPENVIDKILMHLPMKDAVRTSLLSHEWRYKWVKIPNLIFDNDFGTLFKLSPSALRNRIMLTIYQVLLLHRGPIRRFMLSILRLESCLEMDHIITSVSKSGIQDFTLDIWKGTPHKLPSALFSCVQLERLALRSCIFMPPKSFTGFSRLVCLIFREVLIGHRQLNWLIAHCPMLELLTIQSSSLYNKLVVTAHNLKFLHVNAYFQSLHITETPHLASVSIHLNDSSNQEVLDKQSASKVLGMGKALNITQRLHLDSNYLKAFIAGGMPSTLNHVKTLELSAICFEMTDEVTCVLLLAANCPNLQRITITACSWGEGVTLQDAAFFRALGEKDLSVCSLREVALRRVTGSWPELEFIKIVLAKLLLLDEMHIEPDPGMAVADRWRILQEVTQFERASPKAKIMFKNHN